MPEWIDEDCKILIVSNWLYESLSKDVLKLIITETKKPNGLNQLNKTQLIEYIKTEILTEEEYALKTFDILTDFSKTSKECFMLNAHDKKMKFKNS